MSMPIRIARLLVALATVVLCLATTGYSQDGASTITLDRLGDRIALAPGATYAGSFRVLNPSEIAKEVVISVQDFAFYEEGGVNVLDPGSLGEASLADEIRFSPERVLIEPGGEAVVGYEFTVPKSSGGPHWAGLLVREAESASEAEDKPSEGMGFIMNVRIQYLFMVIQMCAEDCPQKEARLSALDVDGIVNEETGARSVVTSATVENTSDRVLSCTGYVEIRGPTGESIARQEISQFTMLPGAIRIMKRGFDEDLFGDDQYVVIYVIDFGGESLIGGQWGFTKDYLFASPSGL
jgi:hypothetical protein